MKKPLQKVRFVIGAILLLGAGLAVFVGKGFAVAGPPADAAPGGAAAQSQPETAPPTIGSEADEKAIRATADEFVRAFDAGDAKAVAALWASDAKYTDESGRSYHGRAAIEKEYADLFQESRGATMTVTIESIRFLGPDIALEKGVATVKSPKADAPVGSLHGGPRQARRQVDHGPGTGRPLRAGRERGLSERPRMADRRLDRRRQGPPLGDPF